MALKLSAPHGLCELILSWHGRGEGYSFAPWIWIDSVWLFWPREFGISDAVLVSCSVLMKLAASFPVFGRFPLTTLNFMLRSLITCWRGPLESSEEFIGKKWGISLDVKYVSKGILDSPVQSTPAACWIILKDPSQCCVEKRCPG